MLSNAYFLTKFRFDTAENEPAKKLQNFKFAKFANFADPNPLPSVPPGRREAARLGVGARDRAPELRRVRRQAPARLGEAGAGLRCGTTRQTWSV